MTLFPINTPDGAITAINPMMVRYVKPKNEKIVLIVFDNTHYIEALGTVALVSQQLADHAKG
jgi:hypothetical protein